MAWLLLLALVCVAGAAFAEAIPQDKVEGGKVTERTWLDETGAAVPGPMGCARVAYSYNQRSVTEKYYDAEGNPFRVQGGYWGKTTTTDGKGQVTEVLYLNEAGEVACNDQGFARMTMSYTSFGAVRRLCYYGENGKKPVSVPSLGYAVIENDYRGKTLTKRTYLDAAGNLVETPMGYAVMVQKVNTKNQVREVSFQHADGSPATCEDGWSRSEVTLDSRGRTKSVRYYREDGSLTDRGAGYAWEEIAYTGDAEKITRYDLNGVQIPWPGGYWVEVREKKDGHVTKITFQDGEGNGVANAEGVGAILYQYEPDGSLSRAWYLDLEGQEVK